MSAALRSGNIGIERLVPWQWLRASDWWEFKLLPVLAIAYLTALRTGHSPTSALPALLWLFAALLPGAAFVSLLNDLTDRADDRAANKANRLANVHGFFPMVLMAFCLAAGAVWAWAWRSQPVIVAAFASGWTAYLLYSLPPFRLKKRGLAGLLCDAVGANLVPALLSALLVGNHFAAPKSGLWLAAVAIWALCWGLRGIIWHQIADEANDRVGGVRTWVVRVGEDRAARTARNVIFPIEFVAICSAIAWSGLYASTSAAIGLAFYLGLVRERLDRFDTALTIARAGPRKAMFLHEYYDVVLPLVLLLAASFIDPRALFLLGAQVILFPRRLQQVVHDVMKLRDPQFKSRRDADK
jgi:hypothetical protein